MAFAAFESFVFRQGAGEMPKIALRAMLTGRFVRHVLVGHVARRRNHRVVIARSVGGQIKRLVLGKIIDFFGLPAV